MNFGSHSWTQKTGSQNHRNIKNSRIIMTEKCWIINFLH